MRGGRGALEDYLAKLERDLAQGALHLLVLAHIDRMEPIHGYGLIKAMSEAMNGSHRFKEGTVYPILAQLEAAGIVMSRWGRGSAGPRRKYYELTPHGRHAARYARDQWRRFQQGIDNVLDGGEEA